MQVRGQPGTVTREDGTLTYDLGGSATATIDFTALRSVDPDGTITGHEWRINGALVSTARDFSFGLGPGTHQIHLTVFDNLGASGPRGATVVLAATNASPQALFEMQVRGQPGTVTREDGTLTYDLGGSATATIDFTNGALVSTARDFSFSLV